MPPSPSRLIFQPSAPAYYSDLAAIESRSNSTAWSASQLLHTLSQYQNLTGFIDNTPVAFVIYRSILNEAEIIHLVCDKKHQGNGYASQLLRELFRRLPSTTPKHPALHCYLEVRAGNKVAQNLYQQLGFQVVGTRKAYYQNRENALIMKKIITHINPQPNFTGQFSAHYRSR